MIPLEWMEYAKALPGYLLIERLKMPEARGGIILPDGSRLHTRKMESEVVFVGAGVDGFEVGERIYLAPGIGRDIEFGVRGQRKLWVVTPQQVAAKVHVEEALGGATIEDDTDYAIHVPEGFDEGDRRGPQ